MTTPPGRSTSSRRADALVAVTVAATLGIVLAGLLPWAHSGRVDRSGFRLARTADRLDLVRGLPFRVLLVGYYLLPAAAALTWLASSVGRRRAAALAAGLAGIVGITAALVVIRSDLRMGSGVLVSLGAGIVAVVAAAAMARSEPPA